jgi:hypothetical protein
MSELDRAPTRLEEWILFYLLQRERLGLTTKGRDLLWSSDLQSLLQMGYVTIVQSHEIPSRQEVIAASTVVILTDKGRNYFER